MTFDRYLAELVSFYFIAMFLNCRSGHH